MEYIISLKFKVKVLIDRFNNKQEKQFIILVHMVWLVPTLHLTIIYEVVNSITSELSEAETQRKRHIT